MLNLLNHNAFYFSIDKMIAKLNSENLSIQS